MCVNANDFFFPRRIGVIFCRRSRLMSSFLMRAKMASLFEGYTLRYKRRDVTVGLTGKTFR